MSLPRSKEGRKYTYGDYLKSSDDERWELIKGVPYDMSPAPSTTHQLIAGEIYRQFANYLLGKTCKAFIPPFDVRLPESTESDEEITTVVQPDLVAVCDRKKLDERGCRGGPDLIVEVLSPSTAKKDMREKLAIYEESGVKEYWVVHPTEKTVMVFSLQSDGRYGKPTVYSREDKVAVSFLDDLEIVLETVFST